MIPNWAQNIIRATGGRLKGDEIHIRKCPYCGNNNWNFQVSISKAAFHCWVCSASGGAFKILREYGITFSADEIKPTFKKKEATGPIELPDCMKMLYNVSRIATRAIKYLQTRDMNEADITTWDLRVGTGNDKDRIGFDSFGAIIAPMYGFSGLEFYCSIDYTLKNKYRLPPVSKDVYTPKKRGSDSIILCEGFFDGTSCYKYSTSDVLILFGKFIGEYQLEMLIKANYDCIYIMLDADAKKEAAELSNKVYKAGGHPFLVELDNDSDPNELGGEITKYIEKAKPFSLTSKSKFTRERILAAL